MSNNYQDWEDDEDFDLEDEPRQSKNSDSDLLKQLRKELKAKTKALSEYETKMVSLESERRQNVIKSVLESKGVSPKIAKFIPNDVEPSAEVIESWIEENADVFGLTAVRQDQAQPDLATLRQIDAVAASAQSPAAMDDLMLRINDAQSMEELQNLIYSEGGGDYQ
jgi:FtsZ-interacting cell division protein YlmF